MDSKISDLISDCQSQWEDRNYVRIDTIKAICDTAAMFSPETELSRLMVIFNGSDLARNALEKDRASRRDAEDIVRYLDTKRLLPDPPYKPINGDEFRCLRDILYSDPDAVHAGLALTGYPSYVPGRTYAYDMAWARSELRRASESIKELGLIRTSDTAILVGNGPSLNKTDFDDLKDRDVFISNYAIKNPKLREYATGVAVTNHLVAEQEPYQFMLYKDKWKFFPIWLRNTFIPDERTVFLNALGGELFCSDDVTRRVAWHSTVSYFWMQILYSIGYKKLLLIGFDNSYVQKAGLIEGDIIRQKEDDVNHFDKDYFKGKNWQAADTGKMAEAYAAAKQMFEADGREIVNCTVGGKLELFRRADLRAELSLGGGTKKRKIVSQSVPASALQRCTPKIAIATAFWKGDVDVAERHWRLLNRVGLATGADHIHVYKHRKEDLPPVTFSKVLFCDVEGKYGDRAAAPHPAGPNLCFIESARMLAALGYTHMFWLEPDCIPTQADWFQPFRDMIDLFPREPIAGVGGGTTSPGVRHWKHHFAGCSIYNLRQLLSLDLDRFIEDDLDVSFDIWLSITYGFITLLDQDRTGGTDSIIVGNDRYDWELVRRPASVVVGMFEHWRPEKFLSKDQVQNFLKSNRFKLYHAIKDQDLLREVFARAATTVSTIIINYNNGPFLKECIASALDQGDLPNVRHEIVVVDDGSTDDSIEIIRSFGAKIVPVLIEHGQLNPNFNQQRAFLNGLEKSSGEIILLLDGDDLFYANKLQKIVEAFQNPDVVLVQHALRLVDENGRNAGGRSRNFPGRPITPGLYKEANRVNFFQSTSGLGLRRSYLKALMPLFGVDVFHRVWTDVRSTRLAPYFGKVVNLEAELGAWRRHQKSDSISNDNLRDRMAEHHVWFNSLVHGNGWSVDYASSHQDITLAKADPFLIAEGDGLVADIGDPTTVSAIRDGARSDLAGWRRGRSCAVWDRGSLDSGTAFSVELSKLDHVVEVSELARFRDAFRDPVRRSNADNVGCILVVADQRSSPPSTDVLADLALSTGKRVLLVVAKGMRTSGPCAAIAEALAYAVFDGRTKLIGMLPDSGFGDGAAPASIFGIVSLDHTGEADGVDASSASPGGPNLNLDAAAGAEDGPNPDGRAYRVEVGDIVDGADYKHVNFGFRDVRLGARPWHYVFMKLQQIGHNGSIEVRRNDFLPSKPESWPANSDSDDWGDFFRFSISKDGQNKAPLKSFLDGLDPDDSEHLTALFRVMPEIMNSALQNVDLDGPPWNELLVSLKAYLDEALASGQASTAARSEPLKVSAGGGI